MKLIHSTLILTLYVNLLACTALTFSLSCRVRRQNILQTYTKTDYQRWKTAVYSNAFDIGSKNELPNGEYSRILITKKRQVKKKLLRQRLANQLLNRLSRSNNNTSYSNEDDEDGYKAMMKPYRPLLEQLLRIPWKLVRKIAFPDIAKEPGVLILVRHGESLWNSNKTFTGWADPDLSERGYREVEHAAR